MNIKVIRSNRRTISIQVNPDRSVTVRAPRYASRQDIDRILKEKEQWIARRIQELDDRQKRFASAGYRTLSPEEIRILAKKALTYIPDRAEYFAAMLGVTYGRITIRNQKTRWGSCSNKGNLNFNCLLMLAPNEVIDYVVVHELCHRKEMNHSRAFWNEVAKIVPDYKECEKWLKDEGSYIIGCQK